MPDERVRHLLNTNCGRYHGHLTTFYNYITKLSCSRVAFAICRVNRLDIDEIPSVFSTDRSTTMLVKASYPLSTPTTVHVHKYLKPHPYLSCRHVIQYIFLGPLIWTSQMPFPCVAGFLLPIFYRPASAMICYVLDPCRYFDLS